MVLDRHKPDAPGDIEAGLATFDTRDTEDSPWVVRLLTDSPWDWGAFISKHRPPGAYWLASPVYDADPIGNC
jgi:hypothetical protein